MDKNGKVITRRRRASVAGATQLTKEAAIDSTKAAKASGTGAIKQAAGAVKQGFKAGFAMVKKAVSRFMKSIIDMIRKVFGPLMQAEPKPQKGGGVGESVDAPGGGVFEFFMKFLRKLNKNDSVHQFLTKVTGCLDPYAQLRGKKCSYWKSVAPGGTGLGRIKKSELPYVTEYYFVENFVHKKNEDGKVSAWTADRICQGKDGGGGYGENWLWTEKMDLRKGPQSWLELLPDSTECGNATHPKKCKKTSVVRDSEDEDYCDSRLGEYFDKGFYGLRYNEWTEDHKAYWSKTNFIKYATKKCEGGAKKGRCKLLRLPFRQGMLRCIPVVDFEKDPRWQTTPEWRRAKTERQALMWTRPAQPFLGGVQAMFMSGQKPPPDGNNLIGSTNYNGRRTLAKAYIRAGDICLKYKNDNVTLPHTRVRCLSQQFRWFSDEASFLTCMNFDPANIGEKLYKNLFSPLLGMLPGNLRTHIGPEIASFLGEYSGRRLDHLLANGPPLIGWYWRVTFGALYRHGTRYLNTFFDRLDIRNMLQMTNAANLGVSQSTSTSDFALDATIAKNRAVYHPGESCPEYVKTIDKNECPDSLPARDAQVTGWRFGDRGVSVVQSQWAGRQQSRVDKGFTRLSYIKQSLCMKFPICNTKQIRSGAHMYDGQGNTRDCGGKGQCMWNMEHGNHCKCDEGHKYIKTLQTCCPENPIDEECEGEATVSPATTPAPMPTPDSSAKREGNETESHRKAFMAGYAHASAKQHHTSANNLKESRAVPEEKQENRAEFKETDWAGCMRKKTCLGGPDYVALSIGNPNTVIKGPEMVSQRCDQKVPDSLHPDPDHPDHKVHSGICASKMSCQWECKYRPSAKTENMRKTCKCVDATEWQCSVKKKLLDCAGIQQLSAANMNALLDGYCGKHMYSQKSREVKYCDFGVRQSERCDKDSECPSLADEKVTCKTTMSVVGCQANTHLECEDMGWEQVAAMYI